MKTLRLILTFFIVLTLEVTALYSAFNHLWDDFLSQSRPFIILFFGSCVIIAYLVGGILVDAYDHHRMRGRK